MTRQAAWTVVRVLLTAAIFAYLLREIDFATAGQALGGFSGVAILILLLLISADRLLMFTRWVMLMRMTTQLPLSQLAHIFFVSSFLGSFLPAGVGGDAARAISVVRQTQQPGAAVASVVVDRLLGLLAVALSGLVGVLLIHVLSNDAVWRLTLSASLILFIGTLAALYADALVDSLLPVTMQHTKWGRATTRLAADLAAYRRRPGILWRVGALSMAVQAIRIFIAWVIGRSLGITLPLSYYWVFMPLNILVTLVPLSLGGFGLPQGAMVWSLAPLGVTPTQAFLLSTLFIFAGIVSNLPGAAMWIFDRRSQSSTT